MEDVLMAEFNLIKRMSNAYRAFQHKTEKKGAEPDFGRNAGFNNHFSNWSYPSWRWGKSTAIDYRKEVGSLDGHSLVACVVNYTGTRLPEAKPAIKRTKKNGDEELDYQHPLAQLILRPNKHHVWANYAQACSMSHWIDGNVFFKIVRDPAEGIAELWYVPHYLIEPRWPGDGKSPQVPREEGLDSFLSHYQFNVPGRDPVLWPERDVVHLKRGPLTESRRAVSPMEPLVKELYGDDKMALFTATIMKNMGIQVPLLSPKDGSVQIGDTEAAAMKESWMQKTTGDRIGEPVINTIPVDVEKFGFSPNELDLSALRMIPESRVAAVTGIPAATLQLMVGLQNGTSYASSEQARQQGYEEVVVPIQQVWAQEFNYQLLPDFEENTEGLEFIFDTSNVRVLEEDKDALVKREAEVFRSGASTINEFFIAIGKKPLEEPLGAIRMVPGIASPMSPERLIEMATKPPNETPLTAPVDQEAVAKFMDIDRMLAGLEEQMREFTPR